MIHYLAMMFAFAVMALLGDHALIGWTAFAAAVVNCAVWVMSL